MLGYLYAYVLGGFTFLPLLVILLLLYIRIYASVPIGDADPYKARKIEIDTASELKEKGTEDGPRTKHENSSFPPPPGANKHLTGWMTVRRSFNPPGSQPIGSAGSKTATTEGTLIENVKYDVSGDDKEKDTSSVTTTSSSGKYSTMILNSYRSIVESRSGTPSGTSSPANAGGTGSATAPAASHPPKEFLFCALKGSVLFMYEDEDQKDCVGVIGVDGFTVGISRGDEEDPELDFKGKGKMLDGELFAKRNAIVLRQIPQLAERRKGARRNTGGRPRSNTAMNALFKGMDDGGLPGTPGGATSNAETSMADEEALRRRKERKERQRERERIEAQPWYFFAKNNVKMEQWYHALLAQASPPHGPGSDNRYSSKATFDKVFSKNDMQNLIDTLNNESDPIPIRWLNAMLGRIFLGLCRTAALEAFIIGKIMKKVKKIKTPSFLGDIVVKEVDVGTTPPFFSKPMLKELTTEGEASFEVEMHYTGDFKIHIATTAMIPTGFSKPYNINLELLAIVKGLHGNMVVQIKKPPSNRLWYSFTKMPEVELRVEPVVSDRKIQLGMVLKAIEKQIRDAIADSVVMPNMDDLAFFDTQHLRIRGGIFDEAAKQEGVAVAGNITGDGLEPIPLSDTSQIPDEPATSQSGLRHRKSKPSVARATMPTEALDLPDGSQAIELKPVARAETEPPSEQRPRAASSSLEATKKWFGHKATSSVDQLSTNETFSGGKASPNSSGSSPERQSSEKDGVEAKPRIEATEGGFVLGTSTATNVVNTSVEAVTSPSNQLSSGNVLDHTDDDNVQLSRLTRSVSSSRSSVASGKQGHQGSSSVDLSRVATSTASAESEAAGLPRTVSAEPSTSGTTAAHLVGSIRSRAADKKALQASVNQAKDAMKKWGHTWAAKRRGTADAAEIGERERVIAEKLDEMGGELAETNHNQRGPSEGHGKPVKPTDMARPQGSLQERLAAAAAAAAVTSKSTTSNTATSADSKRNLAERRASDAGPGVPIERKGSGASSISTNSAPPRPVDSVTPPHDGLNTTQNAIRSQPKGSQAMVVPRVPKRPDTVTAMSSTFVAESSSGPPPVSKTPTDPAAVAAAKPTLPPALPARSRPSLPPLPTQPAKLAETGLVSDEEPTLEAGKADIPTIAVMTPSSLESASMTSSAATESEPITSSTSIPAPPPALPPRKPMPIHRTPSLRDLPDDVPGLTKDRLSTSPKQNVAVGVPGSPSSRTAEDVLKKMVAMDDIARATSPGLSSGS